MSFDPARWTDAFAECVADELRRSGRRLGRDAVRAFAIDCTPWHAIALSLSFLTDREPDGGEKWDLANWRLHGFTYDPPWKAGAHLMKEANDYYSVSTNDRRLRVRELCACCVHALLDARVQAALEGLKLAPDFELYVGNPDEPELNYAANNVLKQKAKHVAIWTFDGMPEELATLVRDDPAAFEDDDLPISAFAAAIGARYYDHDKVESHASDAACPLSELVAECSYGSAIKLDGDGARNARGCVLVYDHVYSGVAFASGAVTFVGNFRYAW